MMAAYTTRPLSDRTWLRPPGQRVGTRFSASWPDTLELLTREVDALNGRNLVIEVDVQESDLRIDGTIRARAKAAIPGVVVAFESKHGPLLYRCDRLVTIYYDQGESWQHNVRAIALTLEALRAVDRYGATASGQQYTGWKAIGSTPAETVQEPLAVMVELAGMSLAEAGSPARLVTLARRNAHPDHGGSSDTWHRFTEAYERQLRTVSAAVRS